MDCFEGRRDIASTALAMQPSSTLTHIPVWIDSPSKQETRSHDAHANRMDSFENRTDVQFFPRESQATSTPSFISVWMDRPSRQESKIQNSQFSNVVENKVKENEIPLYDRACTSATFTQSPGELSERYAFDEPEEGLRCFNCGSYTHSLNDCQRPHDIAAINSSRKVLLEKRGSFARFRPAARYYLDPSGGKFDDLKPGILGLETRKALGIGELDPPPWLHRMRNLGYPPAYLEVLDDEKSSGVEIFGGDIDVASKDTPEDGKSGKAMRPMAVLGNVSRRKRMTVEFPGLNSLIPQNADEKLWAPLFKS